MSVIEEKWAGNIPKRNILLHDNSLFNKGSVLKYNFSQSSNLTDDDANYIGVIEDSKKIILSGYIDLVDTNWSTITSEIIGNGDSLYLSATGTLTKIIPVVGIIKKVVQVLSATEGIVYSYDSTITRKIINFSSSDLINNNLVITNVKPGGCIVRKSSGAEIIPDENTYDFLTNTLTLNFESYNVGTNWKIILF